MLGGGGGFDRFSAGMNKIQIMHSHAEPFEKADNIMYNNNILI